jgi:hypothetical protein
MLTYGTTATIDPSTQQQTDPARLFTTDPDVHVVADTTIIAPQVEDKTYRFDLPAGCRLVRRSFVPAAMRRASGDQRRLGVEIRQLTLDGYQVPPGDRRRCSGWHAAEVDGSTWTDGRAVLDTTGATHLEMVLAGKSNYVRSPLAALTE